MDLTSTVRSDALPSVGTLLVPGAVASTPYVALLWGEPHNLHGFVNANQGAATGAAALLVVAVGLLVESVGSYLEYYVIDRRHKDRTAMLRRWREYLRIAWQTEPVGQHYLRRIMIVFKFELNLLVASVATLPALVALGHYDVLPSHGVATVFGVTLLLAVYLYNASVASSLLLDELRQELIAQAKATGEFKPSDEAPAQPGHPADLTKAVHRPVRRSDRSSFGLVSPSGD
jgi:hypothetical protein